MAERTNMIMIMTSIGLDMKKVMMNGNLISIEGYVLTFVSLERKIGDKLRYELVLIIIADTFDQMKIVRDHVLEIKEPKESRVDKWDIVDNYGVRYFYVSTYEKALILHDTPDTYKGVRSIAIYNLNENPSTINIYEEISKYVNGNVLNMQFEDQRDKNNEMTIDSQQRARRAYAYIGKLKVDITTEMISGMKKYMHYEKEVIDNNGKKTRFGDQLSVLTALPFWTTSYYYHITSKENKKEIGMSEDKNKKERQDGNTKREVNDGFNNNNNLKINAGRGGRNPSSTINIRRKEAIIKNNNALNIGNNNNNGAEKSKKKRWGDIDEMRTSIDNEKIRTSQVNRSLVVAKDKNILDGTLVTLQGERGMEEWREKTTNDILNTVKGMMNNNNRELIDENNRNIEARIAENNSVLIEQMRKDKEENQGKLDKVMAMTASIYEVLGTLRKN